jgi:3',5'-cyclic-AMP phosphodiesterase
MINQAVVNSIRVVQITDTHLFREPSAELLELNTEESFQCVLNLVRVNETQADIFLATGDIAQDASLEAYKRFLSSMAEFPAPLYWIPGNHDRRAVMQKAIGAGDQFLNCIDAGNWQIVMLDSTITGEVHGWLSLAELQHLEAILANADANNSHALICLHHNPVPGNSKWMTGIGLRNAADFFAILDSYQSARAVLYGHIHQALDFERHGVRYLCTPSTCIQFKPAVTDFALDDRNPAYRWLQLYADGRIETAVERVTEYSMTADHSSNGY